MSLDANYLAYIRFGLGPRAGDLGRTGKDPKAALRAEIADPEALLLDQAGLPDSADAYGQIDSFQKARAASRANVTGASPAMPPGATAPSAPTPVPQSLMNDEIAARLDRIRAAEIGFGERLAMFWSNHFAVQAAASQVVLGLAGAFEREAIRPHMLGNFYDMALAATQHPAMLVSLNNASSIGPDSPQGKRSGKGLNENHARELMELHTVGVDAGYTQADVTSFAKVLTGWTFGRGIKQPMIYGRFAFVKQAHEPGPQTVMGKVYPQPGVGQGVAVIRDLSHSAATARHIATQMVRYFVADTPPPALVDRLAAIFTKTQGDLRAVTLALIDAPEAWAAPAEKLRTPQEFLWSAIRALDLDVKPPLVNRSLRDLGQPLWNPPSPQGFKDDAATWLAPDAMNTRVEIAETLAAQDKSLGDPVALAADIIGPSLSAATRTAIGRAESRNQAVALLLMSPEFQRR